MGIVVISMGGVTDGMARVGMVVAVLARSVQLRCSPHFESAGWAWRHETFAFIKLPKSCVFFCNEEEWE